MQIESFSPFSKVWIYQSSRPFSSEEINQINTKIGTFSKFWTAHNHQLHASGKVIEDRFILLIVDESKNEASGCSIDKSVHFIKEIEKEYQVDLFNRMLTTFRIDDALNTIHLSDLKTFIDSGEITEETLFYNTLVQSKSEFDLHFIQPMRNSYVFQFV